MTSNLGAAGKGTMRLETEFRLRLQQRSLEWVFQQSFPGSVTVARRRSAIAPSIWVKLLQRPSDYSSEEALLLCQVDDNHWLAWIPDYGESMLEREQFEGLCG